MSWTDFERLLAERNTDPEAWEEAAKANPDDPLAACKTAVEADPQAAADLLLLLTRRGTLLTTAEVADRLGVAERTVRLWCEQGLFPNVARGPKTGPGAIWLVPESDLANFERPPMGRPRTTDTGDSD